jgi:hypothetical protein
MLVEYNQQDNPTTDLVAPLEPVSTPSDN